MSDNDYLPLLYFYFTFTFTLLYFTYQTIWLCMHAYQFLGKIVINFKLSVLIYVYPKVKINLAVVHCKYIVTMSLTYDGIWFQKHFIGLETIITQNGKSYSSNTTLPLTDYPEWLALTALEWQVLTNLIVLIMSKEFLWKQG